MRLKSLYHRAVLINEKLGEIPLDRSACLREELPQRMRSSAVDANLGEKIVGHVVRRCHVGFDLGVGAWFLILELVTRKSENAKTGFTIGIIAIQSL